MGSRPIILRPSGLRMVDGIPSVTPRSRSGTGVRRCRHTTGSTGWVSAWPHTGFWGHHSGTSASPPSSYIRFCFRSVSGKNRESGLGDRVALARPTACTGMVARVHRTGSGVSILARCLVSGLSFETGHETTFVLARSGIALVRRSPCSLCLRRCTW